LEDKIEKLIYIYLSQKLHMDSGEEKIIFTELDVNNFLVGKNIFIRHEKLNCAMNNVINFMKTFNEKMIS